ncbi:MAG: OmpA family protein [Deltaproteobacteria bacterium]|nr:OmpA family protein [Deltaproteobacteria bacterium]
MTCRLKTLTALLLTAVLASFALGGSLAAQIAPAATRSEPRPASPGPTETEPADGVSKSRRESVSQNRLNQDQVSQEHAGQDPAPQAPAARPDALSREAQGSWNAVISWPRAQALNESSLPAAAAEEEEEEEEEEPENDLLLFGLEPDVPPRRSANKPARPPASSPAAVTSPAGFSGASEPRPAPAESAPTEATPLGAGPPDKPATEASSDQTAQDAGRDDAQAELPGPMTAGGRSIHRTPSSEGSESAALSPQDALETPATPTPAGREIVGPDPEAIEAALTTPPVQEMQQEDGFYVWRGNLLYRRQPDGGLRLVESFLSPEETAEDEQGRQWLTQDADGNVLIQVSLRVWATINFAYDSAELTADAEEVLAAFALSLNRPALKSRRLIVAGHTDGRGPDEYNLELSRRRAASVTRWLSERGGVAPDRLIVAGYGSRQPTADNATEEGQAKNRRVEFILIQ